MRCLGVCLSACGRDLSHCLAFQPAFKLRIIYAVPLFWFTLDRFLPCASIPVTVWVSLPLLTFCHGFGLCFAYLASCSEFFDLLTSTFLGSCPSCFGSLIVVTLSLNDGTSCWLDFNLRPLDPLFIWASRNLKLAL